MEEGFRGMRGRGNMTGNIWVVTDGRQPWGVVPSGRPYSSGTGRKGV